MKKIIYLIIALALPLAGCKEKEKNGGEFIPPAQSQLTQTAYADKQDTGNGFSFTASASWTAAVNETDAQNMSRSAANDNSNNVSWLKLYNGNTETYSGGAGTFSLRVVLDQNYTGEKREAKIVVSSGTNKFTITVVQEATKEDGGANVDPNPVTGIRLGKTQLTLEKGGSETLTAEVIPSNATIKTVTWSSSDPEVAGVHPVTGLVTAVADGSATIMAVSTSNKSVNAYCEVTVGKGDPQPLPAKLVSKITVSSTDPDDDTDLATTLKYDDQNRVTEYSISDFDGVGTISKTTYTYENGLVTANYVYTNGDGSGKGQMVYTLDAEGKVTSSTGKFKLDSESDDQAEETKATLTYTGGELTEVTSISDEWGSDGGTDVKISSKTVTECTWSNGNMTATKEYCYGPSATANYGTRQSVKYGTLKNTSNINLCALDLYVDGAFDEPLFIYGKKNAYMPTEYKSYDWNQENPDPAEPTEKITYTYQTQDGYITKITADVHYLNSNKKYQIIYTIEY